MFNVCYCRFCPKQLKYWRGDIYKCKCKNKYSITYYTNTSNIRCEFFIVDDYMIFNETLQFGQKSFVVHHYNESTTTTAFSSGVGHVPYFKIKEELENFLILK